MENKTYYFGSVSPEDFDIQDPDSLFFSKDKYYWFKLVVEEDQFRIEDTCNRYIPIGFENLGDLTNILNHMDSIISIQEDAQYKIERVLNQLNEFC